MVFQRVMAEALSEKVAKEQRDAEKKLLEARECGRHLASVLRAAFGEAVAAEFMGDGDPADTLGEIEPHPDIVFSVKDLCSNSFQVKLRVPETLKSIYQYEYFTTHRTVNSPETLLKVIQELQESRDELYQRSAEQQAQVAEERNLNPRGKAVLRYLKHLVSDLKSGRSFDERGDFVVSAARLAIAKYEADQSYGAVYDYDDGSDDDDDDDDF